MNAVDVDIERWLALLYEGKGSAARERALRELNTSVDANAFAAALALRCTDERAVPAVAAVVDDWSQRHSYKQRQSLHEVATPLVLALRSTAEMRCCS